MSVATFDRVSPGPWAIVGLGLGPVVLLSGDVSSADPPSGSIPAFWAGLVLIVVGVVVCAVALRRRPHEVGSS